MIDINQPVERGADVVINESGNQHLGTPEEFDQQAQKGTLEGEHYDNPVPRDESMTVTSTKESNGRLTDIVTKRNKSK